ncbi:hypothetical protein ACMHYJ_09955 [Castellaniella hirudinis]|uniref:hypothetical protein n=1 Tax=Castellaniella hirudinis TaxID=1144617 RepID=UPI0039C004C0
MNNNNQKQSIDPFINAYNPDLMSEKHKRLLSEEDQNNYNLNRKTLYALSTKVRQWHIQFGREGKNYRGQTIDGEKEPFKYHPQIGCCVNPLKNFDENKKRVVGKVKPTFAEINGRCYVKGVISCQKNQCCPICALRYEMEMLSKIKLLFESFDYKKKKLDLLTFTAPHQRHQALKDIKDKTAKAIHLMRTKYASKEIKEFSGFVDFVGSKETTYGDKNGWHHHLHDAWLVDRNTDPEKLLEKVKDQWFKCCTQAGLLPKRISPTAKKNFYERSVQIEDDYKSSKYLAKMADTSKWGIEKELAMGSSKTAKKGRYTPFELIKYDRKDLWREWVEASFKTHRIQFGPVFTKMLEELEKKQAEELTPEQIEAQRSIDIKQIELMSDWYNIIRYNYKPIIFEAVEKLDTLEEKIKAIESLIQKLRDKKEKRKDNETEQLISYLENEDREIAEEEKEKNWAEYCKYNSREDIKRFETIRQELRIAMCQGKKYYVYGDDTYIVDRAINAGITSITSTPCFEDIEDLEDLENIKVDDIDIDELAALFSS